MRLLLAALMGVGLCGAGCESLSLRPILPIVVIGKNVNVACYQSVEKAAGSTARPAPAGLAATAGKAADVVPALLPEEVGAGSRLLPSGEAQKPVPEWVPLVGEKK